MDNKNHKRRIGNVLLNTICSLIIVFVGVPLVSGVVGESPASIFVLLALIVGSYSTLYLS